jgi:hypothetical protein
MGGCVETPFYDAYAASMCSLVRLINVSRTRFVMKHDEFTVLKCILVW